MTPDDINPSEWRPLYSALNAKQRPEVGDLVGWRYAAWRVLEVTPKADRGLTDDDRKRMAVYKQPDEYRPCAVVLRHENGPILVEHTQRLHDGTTTVHLGQRAGWGNWNILGERYMTCSCHGHPWPCLDHDKDRLAERQAKRMARDLATTDPGVCASCLEPVTTRQRALTFPEESLIVPGAPGPTFHAGQRECWWAARAYEVDKRLPAYPTATRIASCPGILFSHMADSREECTTGDMCTGHHGPAGGRGSIACVTRHYLASNEGCYPRPPSDCGYEASFGRCLGADHSLGAPAPFTVADQFLQQRGGAR